MLHGPAPQVLDSQQLASVVGQLNEGLAKAKLSQQVHMLAAGVPSSAAALPSMALLASLPPQVLADVEPVSHALFLSNSTLGDVGASREGSPIKGVGEGTPGSGVSGVDYARLAAMKAAVGLAREAESMGLIVPFSDGETETASECSPNRL